jgi:hypothetical protein
MSSPEGPRAVQRSVAVERPARERLGNEQRWGHHEHPGLLEHDERHPLARDERDLQRAGDLQRQRQERLHRGDLLHDEWGQRVERRFRIDGER